LYGGKMKSKQTKEILCLLLVIVVLAVTGCGQSGGGEPAEQPAQDTLSGDVSELLALVLSTANDSLGEDDKTAPSLEDTVSAETSQNLLGLSAADFGTYVESAAVSSAAIITFAHEVALIKCIDFDAAVEVKRLVAEGFDSARWVCVKPDVSIVQDSGSYVLLVVSREIIADAVLTSFSDLAGGNVGEPVTFYNGLE
jgi:hypothetical protein